ncbi:MAG TPA: hypothetical protein VIL20_20005 [Sandaracinaceae bacterium]
MHGFLLVLAAALLGGCYLSHGRGRPYDPDAAVDVDASVPDAGSIACALRRLGETTVRAPAEHAAQAPDVVWTGDAVAVAMAEGGGGFGHPIVTMVEVTPDLSHVSEPRTIGEESHGWGELDLTSDGLAVCWHGDPGGRGRTMIRRVREDGTLGSPRDVDPDGEACLDLVAAGDRMLVAWRRRVDVGGEVQVETRVQVVDAEGAPVGDAIALASAPYPGRSVDLAAADGAFFAALSPENGWVRVLEIARDGHVVRDDVAPIPDARAAAVAVDGDRVALLVGTGPVDVRSLWLFFMDRSFLPSAPPRPLSDGAPTAVFASIEPAPDGWLVTWSDGHQPSTSVTMLHVDRDGFAREPRVRAHGGPNSAYGGPSVARAGDEIYLALARSEVGGFEEVAVQRWRCEPAALDACAPLEVVTGPCGGGEPVAWRWNGADCEPVECPSTCVGEGCDRLAPSRDACLTDRVLCSRTSCDGTESPTRIDGACVDSASVREGEALRVRIERTVECPCGATLECAARVEAPFELVLDTSLCAPPLACDCGPGSAVTLTATCELPPLSAGTWTVRGEGVASLVIEVVSPWETPMRSPACAGE